MKGEEKQRVSPSSVADSVAISYATLSKRLRLFAVFAALLCLAFIVPLIGLVRLSITQALHSHIPLIPVISAYLIWLKRREIPLNPTGSPALAAVLFAIGLVALNAYIATGLAGTPRPVTDSVAAGIFAFVCFLWGGALLLLGASVLKPIAFPVAFLIFMVPMPTFVVETIEVFLQHASAEAAALIFWITGSTVFRDGLVFQLPGITIQVAEECSGIRSTYVLFITSLLAGHLLLHSSWRRALLALFVIPLGILRNGFRVYTIGWLCVHISPTMIDSPIHRRGGPLFFVLSLIPLFLLLVWLYRAERRGAERQASKGAGADSAP